MSTNVRPRDDRSADAGDEASRPPRWAHRLLTRLHPDDTLEEVEGDLEELYTYWYRRAGPTQATLRYLLNVVSVLPPFVRRREHKQDTFQKNSIYHPAMIRTYLKVGVRNLIRNKVYSLINIGGLAAGLTCFAFIALWVQDELSYDRFNQHYDRIVRLTTIKKTENGTTESARTGAPLAAALRHDYAEVVNTVRLDRREEIVQHNNQQTLQSGILLTDPSFFDAFNYPLTRGNAATALAEPYSIVLTESAAAKYFGKADPIGQSLLIYMYDSTGRGANYKVTGITPDPPRNAHFTFSMLGSFKTIEVTRPNILTAEGWIDNRFYTYLLLKEGTDLKVFTRKMSRFYANHISREPTGLHVAYAYNLQPLTSIHLNSHLENEIMANSTLSQVYIFSTIGLLILLLAGINYTNLATARSVGRAKEVGIKKVVGALNTQLIVQYLTESVFMALLAFVLSILVSVLIQPLFYHITDKDLSLFSSPLLLLFLAGLTAFLGVLSGLYPAVVLAGFQPVSTLKGAFKSGSSGILLRQSLIVSQFVITLILITSIVIIYQQMAYINHKDLGYNKDALLMLRHNGNADVVKGYPAFKDALLASPLNAGVAASRAGSESGSAQTIDGRGKPVLLTTDQLEIDADYLTVHGIKLMAGRDMIRRATGETIRPIILNETAVRKLGWRNAEAALGKPFTLDNQLGTVVGVVHDFHYSSLQHRIEPLALLPRTDYFSRITVKINPLQASQSIAFIANLWAAHFPVALFDYRFVDQQVGEQYRSEEQFSSIMLTFSLLSLLIACLGLYGLIAYSTSQKTKEIGIRKVLGATVDGLAFMLSKDFLKLVVLACLVAMPMAWYLMRHWLADFAYHIDIQWWMFAGSGLLVLFIALVTVSSQAIKAALKNPVKSLRSE